MLNPKTLSVFLLLWGVFTAFAQDRSATVTQILPQADFNNRTALVIGNGNYSQHPLANPRNDAEKMAEVLRSYNFNVLLKTDLGRRETNRAITEYADTVLKYPGVSLFYYAGHGVQYNNANYILPVDAVVETESDIEAECFRLSAIMNKVSVVKDGLNFTILDACRNNPFGNKLTGLPTGLTDQEPFPANTTVYFATAPNKVASDGENGHSPFTQSLINHINDTTEFVRIVKNVNKSVKQLTNGVQTPWYVGSPDEDFYFGKRVQPHIPDLYILAVGVSDYVGVMSLRYPAQDAANFYNVFKTQEGTLYNKVHPYLLTNEQATRNAVMQSINTIKKNAREGDVILVYYSGHIVSAEDNRSYFLLSDSKIDNVAITGIDQEQIVSLLSDFTCKSLLFIDGSGRSAGLSRDAAQRTISEFTAMGNNVVVITSTSENEYAYEGAQWNGSVFMRSLIDVLSGGADVREQKLIDVKALADFVVRDVRKLTSGQQSPVVYLPKGWKNFTLSKVTDALKKSRETEHIIMPARQK